MQYWSAVKNNQAFRQIREKYFMIELNATSTITFGNPEWKHPSIDFLCLLPPAAACHGQMAGFHSGNTVISVKSKTRCRVCQWTCWLRNEQERHLFLFIFCCDSRTLFPKELYYNIVPWFNPVISADKRKMSSTSLDTRKVWCILLMKGHFASELMCGQALTVTQRTAFHKGFKYRSTPPRCPQFLLRESCDSELWGWSAVGWRY